ncbi:hypothetical protein BABINDRAFT_7354 [Babjeviella inositovora NRRL Y-12698]|uniref:RINT-1 family protein n=1 Tax=Babjeviella inositovora NRRL Y-12698 TaxID=984486 RepID=A0A1E3QT14_9ASCO|nr:uncharacterized protein BABINDRAFT_7354 [Babjeviella inositovora NRRL Y-12698]ODQ80644.1 hypothetical protein BABINDRAFT_7354 [Babjeviella inositovora NRRL Y-12698]
MVVHPPLYSSRDLDTKLDAELSRVQEDRAAIQLKLQSNDDLHDNSLLHEAVQEITKLIQAALANTDYDAKLASLNDILEVYGPLELVLVVRNSVSQQQAAHSTRLVLVEYQVILQNLSALTVDSDIVLTSLKAISAATDAFAAKSFSESQLQATLAENLRAKVNSVIVSSLKPKLDEKLTVLVNESNWVSADVPAAVLGPLKVALVNLLTLQGYSNAAVYPEPLWALSTLTRPFTTRFMYHFEGNKETNRADKPEWALQFFETFMDNHLTKMRSLFGDIFRDTPYHNQFFVYEIMTSLLAPVRIKMEHYLIDSLNNLDSNPRLLSHLIFELQSFDARMVSKYGFNPHQPILEASAKQWSGLTGDTLRNKDYFQRWLENERELALVRFREIMEADNAFEIDYDFVDAGETKPTVSAINVQKLFENITSHYANIRILKYQLKFLSNIQLHILDLYYDRLLEGFQAFKKLFHKSSLSLVNNRTTDEAQKIQEVQGVERLCRLYCSLHFMINCMEQWSESKLFLQLWARVSSHNSETEPLADLETMKHMFFDTVIGQYRELSTQISELLTAFFNKELKNSIKGYLASSHWSRVTETSANVITPALSQPLQILSRELGLFSRAVSFTDRLFVLSEFTENLVLTFTDYIIGSSNFRKFGAAQLAIDWEALCVGLDLPLTLERRKLEQVISVLSVSDEGLTKMGFKSLAALKESGLYGGEFKTLRSHQELELVSNKEITQVLARLES